jgi:hypothetical protein
MMAQMGGNMKTFMTSAIAMILLISCAWGAKERVFDNKSFTTEVCKAVNPDNTQIQQDAALKALKGQTAHLSGKVIDVVPGKEGTAKVGIYFSFGKEYKPPPPWRPSQYRVYLDIVVKVTAFLPLEDGMNLKKEQMISLTGTLEVPEVTVDMMAIPQIVIVVHLSDAETK